MGQFVPLGRGREYVSLPPQPGYEAVLGHVWGCATPRGAADAWGGTETSENSQIPCIHQIVSYFFNETMYAALLIAFWNASISNARV